MTSKTIKTINILLILILFILIISIATGTYSRYRGVATANAKAQIANWAIKLNAEDISMQSKTINVQATDGDSNENVSEGKIAPGKTMKVELQVDPTGSEVAIDYTFKVDTGNLKVTSSSDVVPQIQNNLSIVKVECKVEADDGTEKVRTVLLDDEGNAKYFENLEDVLKNRKVTFVAYLLWDDGDDITDTQSGMNITSIEAPIIVTAKQHIGGDETTAESLELSLGSLENGGTLSLEGNVDFTDLYAENQGTVLMFPDNSTFNLNGSTVSSNNMGVIYSGNNINIQNGSFTTTGSYGMFVGSNSTSNTITLNRLQCEGGINIYNAKNVILNDVTVNAHRYYAVWGDANSEITINSGTYSTTSTSTALFGRSKSGNVREGFKIYGGTFITNGKKFCLDGSYLPPLIYGGTFDCDVSAYTASGYEAVKINDTTWEVRKA